MTKTGSASKPPSALPSALGYRMPAEWEPHESTWLAWPHFRGDWPGKFEPIPWVYAEIVRNLARHERVDLIVNSPNAERRARAVLELADALSENVRFHHWRTDRVWTRDSGCIFLTRNSAPQGRKPPVIEDANGTAEAVPFPKPSHRKSFTGKQDGPRIALHFQFNGWAKYPNYKLDEKIGGRMAKAAGARVMRPVVVHPNGGEHRVVLEGGSIDVNGCSTLLTTEECLLSTTQQRNPPMDRAAYEQLFADYFGVQSVIWLDSGIAGDDTHGHVDDITRFVAPNTVVTMVEQNEQSENYAPLYANLGRLKAARVSSGSSDGQKLEIVEIPMPRPVVFEGRQLPASYANFYIANGVVLVPVFNDPNDRIALNVLAEVFPTREIAPIYSGDLIWGFGALHCMTQQQPEN
ncbi:MAG: agmatine deiminase family protein [Terriglobales bacterium]|jgi:agmatine deiminase